MRIDKLLSFYFDISRKEVKKLFKDNKVLVNNKIIIDSSTNVNESNDIIYCNDILVIYEPFIYLVLNKPKDYVTSTKDNINKTVLSLINDFKKYNLFPVGRLDIDTTGLLLITNDGNLSHKITSPNSHIHKIYEVTSLYELSTQDINKVKNGIMMDNKLTNPIIISKISSNIYHVDIEDGKYHEVKRIFEYLNNKVLKLKRLQIGKYILPDSLKEGNYIKITDSEVKKFLGE